MLGIDNFYRGYRDLVMMGLGGQQMSEAFT